MYIISSLHISIVSFLFW